MSGDCFIEKITVIDEWRAGNDSYRLIDKGAGPHELQIDKDGEWKPESECYVHSTLTHRILNLTATKR